VIMLLVILQTVGKRDNENSHINGDRLILG